MDAQPKQLSSQALHREVESVADLRIKVSDGAHEACTQVVIKVEDVNDQVPKFVQDKYSFQVEENFPLRQSFGKVSFQNIFSFYCFVERPHTYFKEVDLGHSAFICLANLH